jgi:hypothetical protein
MGYPASFSPVKVIRRMRGVSWLISATATGWNVGSGRRLGVVTSWSLQSPEDAYNEDTH